MLKVTKNNPKISFAFALILIIPLLIQIFYNEWLSEKIVKLVLDKTVKCETRQIGPAPLGVKCFDDREALSTPFEVKYLHHDQKSSWVASFFSPLYLMVEIFLLWILFDFLRKKFRKNS